MTGAAAPPRLHPRARPLGSPAAALGLAILLLLGLCAAVAPAIAPYPPTEISLADAAAPPSARHWFGQDQVGRDILSRVVHGARLSLLVGFIAVGIALLVGAPVGLVAGYAGGASGMPRRCRERRLRVTRYTKGQSANCFRPAVEPAAAGPPSSPHGNSPPLSGSTRSAPRPRGRRTPANDASRHTNPGS